MKRVLREPAVFGGKQVHLKPEGNSEWVMDNERSESTEMVWHVPGEMNANQNDLGEADRIQVVASRDDIRENVLCVMTN